MHDRVPGIFPALVHQTLGRAALVFDKPIAVEIAMRVNPFQRAVGMGKHVLYQLLIGGPVESLTEQDEPQRCGICRAIIRAKRHLSRPRHLAFAIFMQNLARLFIAPIVLFLSLMEGQHAQRLGGKLGIQQQRLVRSDDGIAAEHGGKPGNARRYHVLPCLRDLQSMKVAFAGVYHLIEDAVA